MKRLYIVAGNYQEAKNIASLDFQLVPTQWAYVDNVERLRGLTDFEIVFCGSWRRDFSGCLHDICQYTNHLLAMGRCTKRTFSELNKRNPDFSRF